MELKNYSGGGFDHSSKISKKVVKFSSILIVSASKPSEKFASILLLLFIFFCILVISIKFPCILSSTNYFKKFLLLTLKNGRMLINRAYTELYAQKQSNWHNLVVFCDCDIMKL